MIASAISTSSAREWCWTSGSSPFSSSTAAVAWNQACVQTTIPSGVPTSDGDVLGRVAGRAREHDRGAQDATLRVGILPVRAAVDRPVVVDRGVREVAGVDRVVGMVVAEHDVGDVLDTDAERLERIEDRASALGHPRVDHDRDVAVADQRARARDAAAGRGQRADDEDVDACAFGRSVAASVAG